MVRRPAPLTGHSQSRLAAKSSYDAAPLYLTHVRGNPGGAFPNPDNLDLIRGRAAGAKIATWEDNSHLQFRVYAP